MNVSQRNHSSIGWSPGRCLAGGLLLAWGLLLGSPAVAADKAGTTEAKIVTGPNRQVFVPVEDFDVVLKEDKRGVLMSREEFERLQQVVSRREREQRAIPDDVTIRRIDYRATVVDQHLVLQADVELQQTVDAWRILPLPLSGCAVESAVLNEQPARIGRTAKGQLQLFHNNAGIAHLKLEFSTPLTSAGSDRAATFGLIPAAVASMTVSVPAKLHLEVDGLRIERPAAIDKAADYEVAVGGKKSVSLLMTESRDQQATDSFVTASTGMGLYVTPGEITWQAVTTLQVFGQPIDQLLCLVPGQLEITSVDSTGLERMELARSPSVPDATLITLRYRQPFSGSRTITFRGVSNPQQGESWKVPNLLLTQAASHVGHVAIVHPSGVRLQIDDSQGIRRTSQSNPIPAPGLPRAAGSEQENHRWDFDFWGQDFTLKFLTETKKRQLQAAVATVIDINSRGLDLQVVTTLESLFAPLFHFEFTLPAEWTLTETKIGNQKVPWVILPHEAGRHLVQVHFQPALPPNQETTLTISAHRDLEKWPLEEEPLSFELPDVYLTQASIVEGTLILAAPSDIELLPSDINGLDPADLSHPGIRLGYRYQNGHYSGQLQLSRKPARLSAQTAAFTRLDRDALRTHIETAIDVEGGSVRQLKLAVSELIDPDTRFELIDHPARIVEQYTDKAADGEQVWTLQFDRRVQGKLRLRILLETPRNEAKSWACPQVRVLQADRQNGFLAVEASGDQRLQVTAVDANNLPLTEIDAVELPATTYRPHERFVAVLRYVALGYRLTIAEERFDYEAMPTAICHSARMTTILGQTGETQHHDIFLFTAVGVQSLQVRLPDGADGEPAGLWAMLIDDQPIEVRSNDNRYLIPLPAVDNPAQVRTLHLFYRTRSTPLTKFGTHQHQPPQLAVIGGDGRPLPLEILQRDWTVHYPPDVMLTDVEAPYEAKSPLDRFSLLGRLEQGFRVGSPRELVRKLCWVLMVAGVLLVIRQILRRRAWWMVLTIASTGGVLMLAAALLVTPIQCSNKSAPGSSVMSSPTVDFALTDESESLSLDVGNSFGGGMGGEGAVAMTASPEEPLSAGKPVDESVMLGEAKRDRKTTFDAAMKPAEGKPRKAPAEKLKEERESAVWNALDAVAVQPAAPPASQVPQFAVSDKDGSGHYVDDNLSALPQGESAAASGGTQLLAEADSRRNVSRGISAAGALLSLPITLSPPSDSVSKQFRYCGAGGEASASQLQFDFENREDRFVHQLLVAAVVVVLCWWFRSRSAIAKMVVAILGITLPMGLVTVLPVAVHAYLDGVFVGICLGVALWIVRYMVNFSDRCWKMMREPIHISSIDNKTALLLLLSAGLVFSGAELTAAEKPQAASPTVQTETTTVPHTPGDVVVPYNPEQDPLDFRQVFVPYASFVKWWYLAHPEQMPSAVSTLDGTLAAAIYAAEPKPGEDHSAAVVEVTGRLVYYNFRKHPVKLPVPLQDVSLTSAQLDGKPAVLQSVEQGKQSTLQVVLPTEGLHVLDVKLLQPLTQTGPAGQFALAFLPVPAGRLTVQLPAKEWQIRVNGSSQLFRRVRGEQRTLVEIPIGQGGQTTVAWQPPDQRQMRDLFVHADTSQWLHFDDQGLSWVNESRVKVSQGSINELVWELPADVKVRKISGQDVGGWEVDAKSQPRTLSIFLRRRVDDQTQVEVELFQPLSIGSTTSAYPVAQFALRDVVQDTGRVLVSAADYLQLRAEKFGGLKQLNLDQVPGKLRSGGNWQLAYQFPRRPFSLELTLQRRAAELRTTAQHAVWIEPRKTWYTSRLIYQISGAPRSSLSIDLPADFLLLSVEATGMIDWHVSAQAEQTRRRLTVELAEPSTGQVEVVLNGSQPKLPDDPRTEVDLPLALEVNRLSSQAAIWVDEAYSPTFRGAKDWRSVNPTVLPALLRSRHQGAMRFALESQQTKPEALAIDLQRAAARLKGDSLVLATVSETAVSYTLALQWQITQAATDTFVFTTPAWLKQRLDVKANGLREVRCEELPDGRLLWTVILREVVRERYFLSAQAVLPPAGADGVKIPTLEFLQSEADVADGNQFDKLLRTQRHYLVLVNGSQGQLVCQDRSHLEEVQKEELPIIIRDTLVDQAAELVRLLDPAHPPRFDVQYFQQQREIPAAINLADLTTVLCADGTWRGQAVYRLKNRQRQFLAVVLPAETNVLSLFVAGEPSRPVKTERDGQTWHLVPLPKTTDVDLAFEVKLTCWGKLPGGPLPKGLQLKAEELQVPAPRVVGIKEDAEYGIPVMRTRWSVYVPDDVSARLIDDSQRSNVSSLPEEREELMELSAWLGEAGELMSSVDAVRGERAKYKAVQNLKQMERVIREKTEQFGDRYGKAANDVEVQRVQELAGKFFNKVQMNEANFARITKSQQDANAANGTVATPFGDSDELRAYDAHVMNSDQIILDNGGQGIQSRAQQGTDRYMFFELQTKAEPAKKAAAKGQKAKAALPQIRQQRDLRRKQSEMNILGNSLLQSQEEIAQQQSGGLQSSTQLFGTNAPARQAGRGYTAEQRQLADLSLSYQQGGQTARMDDTVTQFDRQNDPFSAAVSANRNGVVDKAVDGLARAEQVQDGYAAPQAAAVEADFAEGWTQAGGLSLDLQIPVNGRKLSFSKLSGGPKLALAVRPRRSVQSGIGLIWTLVWLAVGLGLVAAILRSASVLAVWQQLPLTMVLLGIVGFFLMPVPLNVAAFLLFVLGAIGYAMQHRGAQSGK